MSLLDVLSFVASYEKASIADDDRTIKGMTLKQYFDEYMYDYQFVEIRSFCLRVENTTYQQLPMKQRRRLTEEFLKEVSKRGLIPRLHAEFPLLYKGHKLHNRQHIYTFPTTPSPEKHLSSRVLKELVKFHSNHQFQANYWKVQLGLHAFKHQGSIQRLRAGGFAAMRMKKNKIAFRLLSKAMQNGDSESAIQLAIQHVKDGGSEYDAFYGDMLAVAAKDIDEGKIHYATYLLRTNRLNTAKQVLMEIIKTSQKKPILADASFLLGHHYIMMNIKRRAIVWFTSAMDQYQNIGRHDAYSNAARIVASLTHARH